MTTSSLDSVVRISKRSKAWTKVDDSDYLAHLHGKFWGNKIGVEAVEGRARVGNRPVVGMVVDDSEGQGQGEEDNGDDDDGDDGDLIPGCRVLDLDLGVDLDHALEYQRIFIRADYVRIYDFLEGHSNSVSSSVHNRPAATVVTGGSGVGKSVWQYYALCRRLGEMKPVIWYHKQSFYLFLEDGVYEMPDDFQKSLFLTSVWTLLDSDESKEGPPSIAMTHGTHLFIIYTTSPAKDQWSRMHKTVLNVKVIMNPWTKAEISEASKLSRPSVNPMRINDIFYRLGPTARLCLEMIGTEAVLKDYEQDLKDSLKHMTADDLERMIYDVSSLSMNAVSHKLCLISRKDRDDLQSDRVVGPMTNVIKSRLANTLRNVTQAERTRLYKHFDKVPESRKMAEIYLESAAQHAIQEGTTFELIPVVVLGPNPKRKRREDQARAPLPQYHSSQISLRDKSLEEQRQQALKNGITLVIPPLQASEYTTEGPTSIEPNILYIPEAGNRVALDSFVVLDGVLYIFQFTIGTTHYINIHLVAFLLGRPGVPSMDKWRFVFVIKRNFTLTCPQPWTIQIPTYTTVAPF